MNLDKEGAFQLDEVIPGDYEFRILFLDGDPRSTGIVPPGQMPKMLGQIRRDVTVPNPPSKDDNSAVDLGTLEEKLEQASLPRFNNSLQK